MPAPAANHAIAARPATAARLGSALARLKSALPPTRKASRGFAVVLLLTIALLLATSSRLGSDRERTPAAVARAQEAADETSHCFESRRASELLAAAIACSPSPTAASGAESPAPPAGPAPIWDMNVAVHKQRYTFQCPAARSVCWPSGGGGRDASRLLAIVVVFSAPGNADRRHAIRHTWGSQAAASNAKVVFLLAYALDGQLRERLRLEAAEHADLIATPNFVDSYDLLTVKSVAMLQWARDACAHARYLVKVDDDVYLSLPNLARALRGLGEGDGDSGRIMLGSRRDGLKVIRNPKDKWYNPLYLKHYGGTYPTYLSGTAYVIAMSIVGQLYDASQLLPYDSMEDVFVTGLCADRVGGVQRVNHKGFYVYTRGACDFADPDVLTSHEVTPEGMLSVWSLLKEGRCH